MTHQESKSWNKQSLESIGNAELILNVLPKLGYTVAKFFRNLFGCFQLNI